MANTSSKDSKTLSFSINYGFLGGSLVGRRMRRLLAKADMEFTLDKHKADIIIAHSAGCWELSSLKHPQLIVLVGLPLARPHPLTSMRVNRARVKTYIKNGHFLRGMAYMLLNSYYALRQPRRNFNIIRHAKKRQAALRVPDQPQIILIANRDDFWVQHATKLQKYLDTEKWSFVSLPGSHDDIWEHPERYVAIIKHYAGLLAKTNQR